MYVSAADNDYVGVTGTFLGTASQGVWSAARLDFLVPPGGVAEPSEARSPGWCSSRRARWTADQGLKGESVSVTDLLADSLALTGLATLDGLTVQGNVGCDQLQCNDVNCTDVFTTAMAPRAPFPAQRSQPQAPSPELRCRPRSPCQAAC